MSNLTLVVTIPVCIFPEPILNENVPSSTILRLPKIPLIVEVDKVFITRLPLKS
jgi:hypothetical protein